MGFSSHDSFDEYFDDLDANYDIAEIIFGFKNKTIIELLKERGQCISALDFNGVKKIHAKINKILENPKQREEISSITHAIIVFRHEKGHDAAINFSE